MKCTRAIIGDEFDQLQFRAYLNHAAAAPMSEPVRQSIQDYIERFTKLGSHAWNPTLLTRRELRAGLAQLVGANDHEIGFTLNTSHGLMVIAQEFPWQQGDSLILIRDEFPANVVPWILAAKRHDLNLIWLDFDDVIDGSKRFQAAMAAGPRLMAISWVQYQTGRAVTMQRLSEIRESSGMAICVDGIQGLVPLTVDFAATPVDFFAAGGHKWMLGPEGAGFLYIRQSWHQRLRPQLVNWLSQENPVDFLTDGPGRVDYDKPFRTVADHIEFGTANNLSLAGLAGSIQWILKLGPENLSMRIRQLAHYLWEQLIQRGLSAQAQPPAAGIVSIPSAGPPLEVTRVLAKKGIVIGTPDGYLRFSPHIHNSEEQIDYAVAELANQLLAQK